MLTATTVEWENMTTASLAELIRSLLLKGLEGGREHGGNSTREEGKGRGRE